MTRRKRNNRRDEKARADRPQGGVVRGRVLPLTMGVDNKPPSPAEEQQRVADLCATVERYLPDFLAATKQFGLDRADVVAMHQDSFAAGYDMDEYTLLGMAIKYAGLRGVPVQFIGRNRETL